MEAPELTNDMAEPRQEPEEKAGALEPSDARARPSDLPVSHDLEAKYSRQMFSEVMLFAQLTIATLVLVGFLVFLGMTYVDVLFAIDFTKIDLTYLNEFMRLFVILIIAAFDVHLIHQIFRFVGRRVLVMGMLKELSDAMTGEGETIWKLRPILWAEGNADVVENEGYFLSLRNGLEMAYKSLMAVQMELTACVKASQEGRDLHSYMKPLGASLEAAEQRLRALRYPYFRDAGYSLGVRFFSQFREKVQEMLQEIGRLMNQFENMSQVEEQRKLERERTRRLELDRQHKINEFALEAHLDIFLKRIDELTPERLRGKTHTKFLQLYNALKNKFVTAGLLTPEKLERIGEDVERINRIEEIVAFYDEKIRMVKNDSVDLTERREKARYWTNLRDQHIAELRHKSVAALRAEPSPEQLHGQ